MKIPKTLKKHNKLKYFKTGKLALLEKQVFLVFVITELKICKRSRATKISSVWIFENCVCSRIPVTIAFGLA